MQTSSTLLRVLLNRLAGLGAVSAVLCGCAVPVSSAANDSLTSVPQASTVGGAVSGRVITAQQLSGWSLLRQPGSDQDALPKSLKVDADSIGAGAVSRHVGSVDGFDVFLTYVSDQICIQFGKQTPKGFTGGTSCDKEPAVVDHGLALLDVDRKLGFVAAADGCKFVPASQSSVVLRGSVNVVRGEGVFGAVACGSGRVAKIELTK